ncbi:hypothetical protein [Agrobacterium pusense]|uniref:hypothetical protein n=1 Tax=Agrobacterium pusense TaxID=648995 RepID=UPI001AE9C026|nr:hypothetical protein [Agrobacterium pusense]MBP2613050.1 hypothetical protein [Agrobacterium pusense]
MMGDDEKTWPGTEAEKDFAKYLVANHGAHFVTVVRRGVGRLLGVSIPRQTIVVKELMDAASKENPSDGRPCSMDVFVAALFEDCDDHFDRADAIEEWLHGDWEAALSYLEDEARERISPSALASTGGEHHAE